MAGSGSRHGGTPAGGRLLLHLSSLSCVACVSAPYCPPSPRVRFWFRVQILRRFRYGALLTGAVLAVSHIICFVLVVTSIKVRRVGGPGRHSS